MSSIILELSDIALLEEVEDAVIEAEFQIISDANSESHLKNSGVYLHFLNWCEHN